MRRFSAGVLLDGWVKVEFDANTLQEAKELMRTCQMHIKIVTPTLAEIGEADCEVSMLTIDIEDVEAIKPEKQDRYHEAPAVAELEIYPANTGDAYEGD